jgi:flagellar protein FliO/FliZ
MMVTQVSQVAPTGTGGFPRRHLHSSWRQRAAAALAACAAGTAHAQAAAEGPSVLPLVLTLVFVLALIPVAVWMLKRFGGGHPASAAGMRVVAQLPLGQRERLVVVEAGERWLILGVTASAISRVGTLPKGELPPAPTATSFASLLTRARRGDDHA